MTYTKRIACGAVRCDCNDYHTTGYAEKAGNVPMDEWLTGACAAAAAPGVTVNTPVIVFEPKMETTAAN